MSDSWIQFVPTDPKFQPTREAAERAKRLLKTFVADADEVNAEFYEKVDFFHPGANWSGVNCPACGKDAETWWGDAMTASFRGGFKDLSVVAPCCGATVSLNEMHYVWPAALGSFALEARNPNVKDLTPEQEHQLASCLDCALRRIWVHI